MNDNKDFTEKLRDELVEAGHRRITRRERLRRVARTTGLTLLFGGIAASGIASVVSSDEAGTANCINLEPPIKHDPQTFSFLANASVSGVARVDSITYDPGLDTEYADRKTVAVDEEVTFSFAEEPGVHTVTAIVNFYLPGGHVQASPTTCEVEIEALPKFN